MLAAAPVWQQTCGIAGSVLSASMWLSDLVCPWLNPLIDPITVHAHAGKQVPWLIFYQGHMVAVNIAVSFTCSS